MLKLAKFSLTKQRFHDKTVLEAPFEKNSCALITSVQLIWENGDRNGRTENKIKGSKVHVHLRCNFCTSFAAPHRGSSSERWYAWNLRCRVSPGDKPFDLAPPIGYLHNSHQSIAAVTFESAPLSDGHSWDVVEMPDNGSAASICIHHREHRESEMRASDNFSLFSRDYTALDWWFDVATLFLFRAVVFVVTCERFVGVGNISSIMRITMHNPVKTFCCESF